MIKVDKLSIETLKGRKLIEDVSFVLNPGDKLAIIGEEGNGKSTLMKAIYNQSFVDKYCTVTGQIDKGRDVIGYLEQRLDYAWDDFTVMDYFLMKDPTSDVDYELYNHLPMIKRMCKKYNLNEDYLDTDMQIKHLSGGEKVKLQLVKLSLYDYDAYFLDEPTNDLDIETLEILENFMLSTTKPILFISHDETLLENVANRILHIEQLIKKTKPKFTLEKASYAEYVDARNRAIEHQTQMAYSQRREKEKKEEVLRQIKQKVENALVAAKKDPSSGRIIAKKMANIKAQERRNENEEMIEIPDVEEAIKLVVDKTITLPAQKRVLDFKLPVLSAGSTHLANNVELKMFGPDRIAIVGKNGCGKSTLIKKLYKELQNVPGVKVGYFSQNYSECLDYSKPVMEELQSSSKDFNPRTLLGSLKFTREEMLHSVADLSEGQKAKVLLMKMIIEGNNVLVMDEPTRNLSPLSNPVIRRMLNEYNGAIITISHDRKFIKEVCDKVYVLNRDGLTLSRQFSSKEVTGNESEMQ